ncbi:MAG TPA: CHAT domain-containing protein [Kofleriaceae bacterium]|nr:CHAT domain-containing protein [Kofleriaceae bacterium]
MSEVATLADSAIDEHATKAKFTEFLGYENILHVSSHGEWFGPDPELSGVLLEDGRYGVADVLAVRCRAPLVILSACDSGRMHVAPNDDPFGLVAALMTRGTANVIACLWPVSASAAKVFVIALIENIQRGTVLIEAMRLARNRLRAESADIADWGAFELFGVG